jgi:hypothetical protein
MISDYKMVLHNSAIEINDYDLGDCPTLENNFCIWDQLYHRKEYLGIYFDKQNRKVYLPRGVDVDYIRRKLQSTMEDRLSSTIVHNHKYGYTKKIKMKLSPRDETQNEALRFILCKDKYVKNSNNSQFSLNLLPGAGKTYLISCVISYLGIKTIVITAQSGILDQWKERLQQYTNIDESEIVKIEGGPMIGRILNGNSTAIGKSVYLCTHSTLQTYGTQHGWDKVSELFKKLEIGIKVFDEAHQNFQNMSLIDFAARDVWRTYYVTATPARSDRKEDQIYKTYMKNIPSIDLFNPNEDPHTSYIAIKYNSYPRPSDINGCKNSVYGISNPLYIDYLMRNDRFWIMFDYIFSLIYKAGGRALFYIGTNSAIAKIYQRIMTNYPELYNDVGIYTSVAENKQEEKTKKYILTTTKSAGAGEDIAHLKYSVVLAEPFKSEVLARQTLGRTRDRDTVYIELVDVGFKQIVAYYNAKRSIFSKYATKCSNMNVDNGTLMNLEETTRLNNRDRFKQTLEFNSVGPKEVLLSIGRDDGLIPALYFSDNSEL